MMNEITDAAGTASILGLDYCRESRSNMVDRKIDNQRVFPRITVTCPVLYRLSAAKRWQVARLVDFSATGVRMVCDDNLTINSEIAIQIKPGSQKTVPALAVTGVVVRSAANAEQRFEISCKVIKVHR
jgi:hypothetical protein